MIDDAESLHDGPTTAVAGREQIHAMLEHVFQQKDRGALSRFTGGVSLTFHSAKFLLTRPKLWPSAAIPAAINFVLFVGIAGLAVWNSGTLMDAFWAQPAAKGFWGWIVTGGWWIVRVLLVPLLIIFSYFVTMAVGSVVASPFNDALSEKVEELLLDRPPKGEQGFKALVAGGVRGVAQSAALFGLYVLVMAPILLLNLIPGIGSIAASVLGGVVSALFLAVEFSDYSLERRRYTLRQKLAAIWKNRSLSGGFGIGTSFLLWIPLVNFLCLPIAVIGGTTLAIGLDETDPERG